MDDRKPSPEIEQLIADGADPRMVKRYFEGRARKLSRDIAALSLPEQLRTAADLLEVEGGGTGLKRFAMQIAEHVARKLAKP